MSRCKGSALALAGYARADVAELLTPIVRSRRASSSSGVRVRVTAMRTPGEAIDRHLRIAGLSPGTACWLRSGLVLILVVERVFGLGLVGRQPMFVKTGDTGDAVTETALECARIV